MRRQRLDPMDSAKCASIAREASERMGWRTTKDLTAPSCVRWLQGLADRGLMGGTLRNRLSVMRGFGRYLVEIGEWSSNPLREVRSPRVRARERGEGARAFEPEEVKRLIEAARVAEKAHLNARRFGSCRSTLYRTLWDTGLRYTEAMRLRVRYADLDGLRIRVKGDKSGRGDTIPITSSLADVLNAWIQDRELEANDPLFVRVSHRTLVRDMERAGVPREVNDARGQWHCFRKGIITYHLRQGLDLKVVQEHARHASSVTTLNHYYRLQREQLTAPVDNGLGV